MSEGARKRLRIEEDHRAHPADCRGGRDRARYPSRFTRLDAYTLKITLGNPDTSWWVADLDNEAKHRCAARSVSIICGLLKHEGDFYLFRRALDCPIPMQHCARSAYTARRSTDALAAAALAALQVTSGSCWKSPL